jgi:hypothetical protein
MIKNIMTAAVAAALLGGCGSITRGTTEDVAINSTPIGAKVTTDIGMNCSAPCTLKVPRNKDFTITASAEGYKTSTLFIGRKVSGNGAAGMAGNVLVGGIIGVVVDSSTGAAMDHTPNPAFIVLVKDDLSIPGEPPVLPVKKKPLVKEPSAAPIT